MGWQSERTLSDPYHWSVNNTWLGLTRVNQSKLTDSTLAYVGNSKTYSPEKTYIFRTLVNNFNRNLGGSSTVNYKELGIRTPWGESFTYSVAAGNESSKLPVRNDSNVYLTYYSKPSTTIKENTLIRYIADYNGFGTSSGSSTASVIKSIDVIEVDWLLQGWVLATSSLFPNGYEGWNYNSSENSFTYIRNKDNLAGGDVRTRVPGDGYTRTNYIAKYVPFSNFNLSFNYLEAGLTTYCYVDLYLVTTLSGLNTLTMNTFTTSLATNGQYIGRVGTGGFTQSSFDFYNLTGNQYILFNSNYDISGLFTTFGGYYTTKISNILITGGYSQTDNNEQFLLTNTNNYFSPTPLNVIGANIASTYSSITTTLQTLHYNGSQYFGATGNPGYFSSIYGQVLNLSEQNSKLGNGTFRAGIWENGVWNSGWRVDEEIYEFNDVVAAFTTTTKNYKWRVQISGPSQSVEQFKIGDKVSISNIVAITINGERKLLKKYFTVILKDGENLVVEIENNFPFRRVIKDSIYHRIKITKNIWLNGAFLNGYFEGIWNSGLLRGYPYITEMHNTHWIDGTFNGGHFQSEHTFFNFENTIYSNGYVGLTLSNTTPHDLKVGELIVINKDDRSVNYDYDGTASVLEVINNYFIVTDIPWGQNTATESGTIRKFESSSMMQNVKFYDNNVAPKNAKQSKILKDIWRFNSWLDLTYSTQSTTTINRDRLFFNEKPISSLDAISNGKFGMGDFTVPNLYGPITEDVLSSKSYFRDIDSFNKREYDLGTKYEIFTDFLGDISEFNDSFTTGTPSNMSNFFNDGWTYSFSGTLSVSPLSPIPIGFTMSRTTNGTLKIEFPSNSLGILNLDNTNINIEKRRYSVVEFDIVGYGTNSNTIYSVVLDSPRAVSLFNWPYFVNDEGRYDYTQTAFPVSNEINYGYNGRTPNKTYFYNRKGLDILFLGYPGLVYELDNIKFHEIDSIPFFQYTTEDYVNKQVQVPYQGRAPFINYSNANFSVVDNINIGFDSIAVNASNVPTTIQAAPLGIAYTG